MTTAKIQDLVRHDWTIAPGIGSNSNQRFQDLVQEVARLIHSSFHGLDRVMVERDSGLIMAQLAHIHHLFPIDQFEVDEDGTVRGKIYWQGDHIEFESQLPGIEGEVDEKQLLDEFRKVFDRKPERFEHHIVVENGVFVQLTVIVDGRRFLFRGQENGEAATRILDEKVHF